MAKPVSNLDQEKEKEKLRRQREAQRFLTTSQPKTLTEVKRPGLFGPPCPVTRQPDDCYEQLNNCFGSFQEKKAALSTTTNISLLYQPVTPQPDPTRKNPLAENPSPMYNHQRSGCVSNLFDKFKNPDVPVLNSTTKVQSPKHYSENVVPANDRNNRSHAGQASGKNGDVRNPNSSYLKSEGSGSVGVNGKTEILGHNKLESTDSLKRSTGKPGSGSEVRKRSRSPSTIPETDFKKFALHFGPPAGIRDLNIEEILLDVSVPPLLPPIETPVKFDRFSFPNGGLFEASSKKKKVPTATLR